MAYSADADTFSLSVIFMSFTFASTSPTSVLDGVEYTSGNFLSSAENS